MNLLETLSLACTIATLYCGLGILIMSGKTFTNVGGRLCVTVT